MIKPSDRILAEILVKRRVLTQPKIDQYLAAVASSQESFKSYLIRNKYVPEQDVLDALASGLQLQILDLKKITVKQDVIEKVPVRFAWYYKFMPIKIENKSLILACASPLDVKVQDEIKVHLGLEPKIVLAKESDVMDALNRYYGLAADTIERLAKESKGKPAPVAASWVEDLEKDTDEATIANLVNQILLEAYKKRATDIHIEPYRNKVRVRYRIDGALVDANIPPAVKNFLPAIISRIKIMANLSIVEKRLPQDGSTVVKTKEHDLDLRISTIPIPHGESMVIRILPANVTLLRLENLGLDEKNLKLLRQLIKKPHGIILATGPTGSGKTTTLYACLNEINSPDRKIITLEDPIEYEMDGITQIQVNPKVNLSFAAGLRSVLRHDPDILMVGEVRDLETAEIAIRTALTGHMVFSTLHTNDAASGVTRLVEMGLEPYLVASSIEAFVAQRVVRIICPQCKEEDPEAMPEIKEEIVQSLRLTSREKVKIYRGRGCDYCNQTGFYGRTAIYEMLVVNEDMRAAILDKQRADSIKKLAMQKGMLTLRQDGWRKVINGVTTPTEVINVTLKDERLKEQGTKTPAPGYVPTARPRADARVVSRDILGAKDQYNARIYTRLVTKVGIRYSIVQQEEGDPPRLLADPVEHASVTKDISAGGLRFVSGYTLPKGTILELKIQLAKGEPSIKCLGRVCRVEDDELSAMFNIVAYFLDLPSADRAKIDQFVKTRGQKVPKKGDSPSGK